MGAIVVSGLGKAYKQYPTRWSRLAEWMLPGKSQRHTLHWVLKEISFRVEPGESVGIIGINGAGKSTLLKLITGTTQPTTGSVETNGSLAALLELGMGFHPEFTGRQNAIMAGQLLGMCVKEIEALMPEIEAFAGIGEYIDQPVRIYSSGMQVRLAFSVATASRPDILIVDEALSVGDIAFQAKCFRRIKEFKDQGTTLLFVSHGLDDIVRHCHRALLLEAGRIAMGGEPREVVNEFRDRLFGRSRESAAINQASEFGSPKVSRLSNSDVMHTRPLYQAIEHRWGAGGATITDFRIAAEGRDYPAIVESGVPFVLAYRTVFTRRVNQPIFGLLIKTHDGVVVYGTNSAILNAQRNEKAEEGQAIDCVFSLPLRLNAGSYLISLGVTETTSDGSDMPLDRRYDSIRIDVHVGHHLLGICNLQASCAIELAA